MTAGWRLGPCRWPAVLIALVVSVWPASASAAERYALIIAGAAGGAEQAQAHARWLKTMGAALRGPLRLPPDHVFVLADADVPPAERSTAENVRRVIGRLQSLAGPDDVVLLMLVGHGSWDGEKAKFNLVGPDLDADEWAALLRPTRAHLVVVDTTASSFPFMERLAGRQRVVITATDSAAQKFATVFADYFTAAWTDAEADLDKDKRVSVWEAFAYASGKVKRHYEQRGQLATERALLDDNGDGLGKEAGTAGPDGAVASRVFLDAGPDVAANASPALSELLARRQRVLADLDELKRKKTFMPEADYGRELERMLVEIARISKEIRAQS